MRSGRTGGVHDHRHPDEAERGADDVVAVGPEAIVRVCELAVEIIEAQRREIGEMNWLISDIESNGPAATAAEAEARPVPEFEGFASRSCD